MQQRQDPYAEPYEPKRAADGGAAATEADGETCAASLALPDAPAASAVLLAPSATRSHRRTKPGALLLLAALLASAASGCTGSTAGDPAATSAGQRPATGAAAAESPSAAGSASSTAADAPAAEDLLRNVKELTVWSYFDMGPVNARFQERYPDVRLTYKEFPFADYTDAYVQALVSGHPPDVMLIDNSGAGRLGAIGDAFDNLLEPPYDGGQAYADQIPPNMRKLYYSTDGSKLIGVPNDIVGAGAVTFYRKDLFEQYGLPSEPEELAQYLATPENWIRTASLMRKDGRYIFQWDTEPLDILAMESNFFDEEYRFLRNTALFARMLEAARSIRQNGLSLHSSIWTQAGQEAIRSGQLAAVYMGSWGVRNLENWAPETKGKWRATRLPLGLYGTNGGSILSIPSEAANKSLAWEYVRTATSLGKTEDLSQDVAFMGGQNIAAFFQSLPARIPALTPSPFDARAQGIWTNAITDAVATDRDAASVLASIQQQIEAAVAEDRKVVLSYRSKRTSTGSE